MKLIVNEKVLGEIKSYESNGNGKSRKWIFNLVGNYQVVVPCSKIKYWTAPTKNQDHEILMKD